MKRRRWPINLPLEFFGIFRAQRDLPPRGRSGSARRLAGRSARRTTIPCRSTAAAGGASPSRPPPPRKPARAQRFYFNFTGFPFPLGPFLNRRSTRTEAVKGSIWLFEQEQALGFSSVSTNIRMTVVKLKSGGPNYSD